MAVRLSVVMVQTPPQTAHDERIAEQVVGELIGQSGFDLTLVGPLEQLSDSSADSLSLAALGGDVAVLAWQSPAQTQAALNGIGFAGQRSRHTLDPTAPPTPPLTRRIFAFDLTQITSAEALIEALSGLKASHQVQTVPLGLTPQLPPARGAEEMPRPPADVAKATPSGVSDRPTSEEANTVRPPDTSPPDQPSSGAPPLDLDDLVDQLDRLDP